MPRFESQKHIQRKVIILIETVIPPGGTWLGDFDGKQMINCRLCQFGRSKHPVAIAALKTGLMMNMHAHLITTRPRMRCQNEILPVCNAWSGTSATK